MSPPHCYMSVLDSTNPGDVRAIYVPLAIPSHSDHHCLSDVREMSRLECLIMTTVDLNQRVPPNCDMSVLESTNPGDVRAIYVPLAIPSHSDYHYPFGVREMSQIGRASCRERV